MLSTTVVHICLRCGNKRLCKNGHTDNGAQRTKRLECESTFVLQTKSKRYDQKFKDQVVAACQNRMSIRGVARTFGVCYHTFIRWVGKKRKVCPPSWTRSCPPKIAAC